MSESTAAAAACLPFDCSSAARALRSRTCLVVMVRNEGV